MNTAQQSSKKPYIILAVIVLVAVSVYFYYQGTSPLVSSSVSQTSVADQEIGAQVLGLLQQIKSLKVDPSVFSDPGYLTLQDYTVQIPALPVGRPNPFAPLPGLTGSLITGH